MKTYLVARREELKKRQNKGFTLMEMLIVVAIIAVLIAIAIPVFTGALHDSQDATDIANCRSLYADLQADYMTNRTKYTGGETAGKNGAGISGTTITFGDGQTYTLVNGTATATFTKDKGWTVAFTCSTNNAHNQTFGGTTTSTEG